MQNLTPCVAIIDVVGKTSVIEYLHSVGGCQEQLFLPQESYHTIIPHLRDMPISQFSTEALARALPYDLCC